MEEKIAHIICSRLLMRGSINDELEDIYVYGIELILSFIISTSLIILIGILSSRLLDTVVFLLVFIILRRFTGGYHASSFLLCKIVSILTYFMVMLFSSSVVVSCSYIILLSFIGVLTIAYWGPIENPNKPLSISTKKKCRIFGIITFVALLAISSMLIHFNLIVGQTVYFSLFSVIALMQIEIIKRKEANSNENH